MIRNIRRMRARRSNNDAICVDHIAMKRDNDAISISQPKRLVSSFKVADKSEKYAKC